MPAKSEKARKFFGAELQRKREGQPTKTNMSATQLRDFAAKPVQPGPDLKRLSGRA